MSGNLQTSVIVMLTLLVGIPALLCGFGIRSFLSGRRRNGFVRIGIAGFMILLYVSAIVFHFGQIDPWQDKILISGQSPDGDEYCVVQTYTGWTEPYQVSFYMRDPNGVWHWYYLAHQDTSWRSAKVQFKEGQAVVSREGSIEESIPVPPESVDLSTVLGGYKDKFLPASYSVDDVFAFHNRKY